VADEFHSAWCNSDEGILQIIPNLAAIIGTARLAVPCGLAVSRMSGSHPVRPDSDGLLRRCTDRRRFEVDGVELAVSRFAGNSPV